MGDEAAAASLAVDQPLIDQHLEDLADRIAADLVSLDQFGFGRHQIARLPFSTLDFSAQYLIQLLVEGQFTVAVDCFWIHY